MYTHPALVPPMPWTSKSEPPAPSVSANKAKGATQVRWSRVPNASKYVVQARYGSRWNTVAVTHGGRLDVALSGSPDAVAVSGVDRFGTTSKPTVLARK
jgi:hypothetical protein